MFLLCSSTSYNRGLDVTGILAESRPSSNSICEFNTRLDPELYNMAVYTSVKKNSVSSVVKILIHTEVNTMRQTVC